jgi:plastocyanin
VSPFIAMERSHFHPHFHPHFKLSARLAHPLRRALLGAALSVGLAAPALAADVEMLLVIKDHRFEPAELKVPAGQRVKLIVHNQDKTPEEFESKSLNREKVIPGGGKATIFIGPLKPGRYGFFGEFNEKTAQGVVVAE